MLNFEDWKNSVVGKPLIILPSSQDSHPPHGQCFDVVASWTDNLGIPHFPGNPSPFPYPLAYEIYTLFGSWQAQYFDRIANGLFNAPQKGDIVVLRPNHVVVATGNNSFWNFEAVSQNYGSNPNIVSVMSFPYNFALPNSIYGWLRPKNYPLTPPLTDAQKISKISDLVKSSQADSDVRYQIKQILGL